VIRKAGVYLIACGALAEELRFLQSALPVVAFTLDCLPAIYHNRPEKIAPALREKILIAQEKYEKIFIGYGDCGSRGEIDALCAEFGIERLPGAHCYAFFYGVDAFAHFAEERIDVFYLTDFLAKHFENFVVEPLGLRKYPELRNEYFRHYHSLVYLAQTENPEITAQAEAAAAFLGLAFERRYTGYGELQTNVEKL
jgi:hypothetical protein